MKRQPRTLNEGSFIWTHAVLHSIRRVTLILLCFIVISPALTFAAPSGTNDVTISGDPMQPTLSWDQFPDGGTGTEWTKMSGEDAGGYHAPWEGRQGHTTTTFNGKIWMIGGATQGNGWRKLNDVWSSSDGVSWTEEVATAPWAGREGHTVVVFNNKLWLMGGMIATGFVNDVWSSVDGVNWIQESADAPWENRSSHTSVAYNNKLWVMGGVTYAGVRYTLNDVWSSTDGVNWTREVESAAWSDRVWHNSIIFNNKMWVMGGSPIDTFSGTTYYDVWSSSDGITWTQSSSNAGWSFNTTGHSLVEYNNKLWAYGSWYNGSIWQEGLWTSVDGTTWTQEAINVKWQLFGRGKATVLGGDLFLVGAASNEVGGSGNEIWRSVDGLAWQAAAPNPPTQNWLQRQHHETVNFDNKMWVIGGTGAYGNDLNDVWYSSDGVTWTEATANAQWEARSRFETIVFDNKMWVIGGYSDNFEYLNDVWYSSDGVTWTEATANAQWVGRSEFGAMTFDNKMWVMGGESDTTASWLADDVWYSSDGVTWTEATANAQWGDRGYFASTVFDNKMWVMGGYHTSNWDEAHDVWSSTDGVTWNEVTNTAPWPVSMGQSVEVLNGRMWMMGGYYEWGEGRDVWSSMDGNTWTEATGSAPWLIGGGQSIVVFNNQLWFTGGRDYIDGVNTNNVWSSQNDAISHYGLCWGTQISGCDNKAQTENTTYTLEESLNPGIWYFSVSAETYSGDTHILSANTVLTVEATPGLPNAGQGMPWIAAAISSVGGVLYAGLALRARKL